MTSVDADLRSERRFESGRWSESITFSCYSTGFRKQTADLDFKKMSFIYYAIFLNIRNKQWWNHKNVNYKKRGNMFLGKYIQLKCNCNLETKIGFANKRCMPTKCLLDNIYVCFGKQSFRRIVGILLITHCDPLIADLNLYCYKS